jgi:hypothetical protein
MKGNKLITGLLILFAGMILLESCASSSKGCGCGSDLNRVYKTPKRYR